MKKAVLAITVLAAMISGCSTIKVNTDHDPGANFSQYRTYYWVDRAPESEVTTLTYNRIVAAVDEQLTGKGMTKVPAPEDANLLVNFHALTASQMDMQAYNYGYWRGYTSASIQATSYEEGTLIIDLVDPILDQAVWRGWASAAIGNDPQQTANIIKEAVQKMFKKYPPK